MRLNKKDLTARISGKGINGIIKAICGEMLGSGCYRDVYVLKQNPNYVVKIERDPSTGAFCNVTEWRNWVTYKDFKFLSDWLAPCELITETGQMLIQRRVTHKRRKDYPKYVLAVLCDLKLNNFGWIGDKFVCCDYPFIPFYHLKTGKNSLK